jgi:hypothetical protein
MNRIVTKGTHWAKSYRLISELLQVSSLWATIAMPMLQIIWYIDVFGISMDHQRSLERQSWRTYWPVLLLVDLNADVRNQYAWILKNSWTGGCVTHCLHKFNVFSWTCCMFYYQPNKEIFLPIKSLNFLQFIVWHYSGWPLAVWTYSEKLPSELPLACFTWIWWADVICP